MNQTIYQFLCNYLTSMNISFHTITDKSITLSDIDSGLRNSILKDNLIATVSSLEDYHSGTLYHFSDYYKCNYTFFQIADDTLFFIGPYLFKNMNELDIQQLMATNGIPHNLFPQLRDYYYHLPLITGKTAFYVLIRQAYQEICGKNSLPEQTFDLSTLESREEYLRKHTFIVPKDPILSMNMLEKRYEVEDTFLDAVALGNTAKTLAIIQQMANLRIPSRIEDELRSRKNIIISLNTLMRRTAYTAGVHPFYIDSISRNYAYFIETADTIQELEDVLPYMARSYCELVEKRSSSLYSAPVRHILVTIDASIDGDLSLKRFANELFLNTSYLSSLFKKETGMTLTDYVNQHRITQAKRLLKSTTLSIQAIAASVGISDIHYFTRLFRRITGISPREYRKR